MSGVPSWRQDHAWQRLLCGVAPSDVERVERFLGEFRMMVTAVGVLVAFQLQAAFSPVFLDADLALRRVHVVGTLASVVAFACFLVPASIHRLASQARNTDVFIRWARRAISVGFLLLGASLTLGVYGQATLSLGKPWGLWTALATLVVLGVAWALVPRLFRRHDATE